MTKPHPVVRSKPMMLHPLSQPDGHHLQKYDALDGQAAAGLSNLFGLGLRAIKSLKLPLHLAHPRQIGIATFFRERAFSCLQFVM